MFIGGHIITHTDEEALQIAERFIIFLNQKTNTATDNNMAGWKLFDKNNNIKLIHVTRGIFGKHVKRAVYNGSHVWGKAVVPVSTLCPPTQWGWVKPMIVCTNPTEHLLRH